MKRRPNKATAGYVYILFDHIRDMYKIGFTKNDVETRVSALKTANAGICLEYAFVGTTHDESDLHQKFVQQWIDGEWFALMADDLKWIKQTYQSKNDATGWFLAGCYPGHKTTRPDGARIARVLSKYRPSLRASKLAEQVNEQAHFENIRKQYGDDYLNFTE